MTFANSDLDELLDAVHAGGDIDVVRRGVEPMLRLIRAIGVSMLGAPPSVELYPHFVFQCSDLRSLKEEDRQPTPSIDSPIEQWPSRRVPAGFPFANHFGKDNYGEPITR